MVYKSHLLSALLLLESAAISFAGVHQNPEGQIIGGDGFTTENACGRILNPGDHPNVRNLPELLTDSKFVFQGQYAGPIYNIFSNANFPGKKKFNQFTRATLLEYNFLNLIESRGRFEIVNGVKTFVYGKLELPKKRIQGLVNLINRDSPDIIVGAEIESYHSMEALEKFGIQRKYLKINVPGNDDRISLGVWVASNIHANIKVISTRHLNHIYGGETVRVMSRDFPVVMFFDPDLPMETSQPYMMIFCEHGKSQRDPNPGINDPRSRIKRGDQAKVKRAIVDYFSNLYPKAKRIITGDFNADVNTAPELEPFRTIPGMIEIQEFLGIPLDQRYTHSYFPNNGPPSYSQLDGIYVDRDFVAPNVLIQGGPVDDLDEFGNPLGRPLSYAERERRLSDHRRSLLIFKPNELFNP